MDSELQVTSYVACRLASLRITIHDLRITDSQRLYLCIQKMFSLLIAAPLS
jgi:hypothetical protein